MPAHPFPLLRIIARALCRVFAVLAAAMAVVDVDGAAAQDYIIPSTRWIMLSSPLFPRSHEECNALAQEFAEAIHRLSEQHEACLAGAPSDDPNTGGSCSKASCQALHTARDRATRKSSEEGSICREKVNAHLAKEREAARRRAEADREQAREEADRKARRDAEKRRDEQDAQAREAARQRDAQQERERADRDAQERQALAATAQRDQERAGREAERTAFKAAAEMAAFRAAAEARAAEQRARAAEAQKKRDAQDYRLYQDLVARLKEAKDTGSTALALMKNPFGTALDLAAGKLGSTLVDKGLDTAAPIGAEKADPRYEAVVAATDEMRSQALGSNPFAEKLSSLAMEGVHKINRQTLGQLDELGRAMDQVGAASASPQSTARAVPSPTATPAPRASTSGAGDKRPAVASARVDVAEENPFRAAQSVYKDESSGRSYHVPDGYTLYRATDSDELTVIPNASVPTRAIDDRMINGKLQCSATGRGRIIPECERRRKGGNPFAAK